MYPIYAFGSRGAEGAAGCPKMADGRDDRLLRPHRARLRLQPGRHAARTRGKDGDCWVLNGTKTLDHQRHHRRRRIVWAKDATTESIRGFLVETRHARVLDAPTSTRASSRCARRSRPSSSSRTCAFRSRHMLPGGRGPARARSRCLTQARYGIAWGALGAAHGVLRRARSTTRRSASSSASRSPRYQLVQQKLAEMLTRDHEGASSSRSRLGRLKDEGKRHARSRSRWPSATTCDMALEIARMARDILGAQRHHRRVPGHPPHAEPRDGLHVRGHARHPHAHRRAAT